MEESIQVPCYKVKDWRDKPKSEEAKDIQRGKVVEQAGSSKTGPHPGTESSRKEGNGGTWKEGSH